MANCTGSFGFQIHRKRIKGTRPFLVQRCTTLDMDEAVLNSQVQDPDGNPIELFEPAGWFALTKCEAESSRPAASAFPFSFQDAPFPAMKGELSARPDVDL